MPNNGEYRITRHGDLECFFKDRWYKILYPFNGVSEKKTEEEKIPFFDKEDLNLPITDKLDDYDVEEEEPMMWGIPDVRRVIFNNPATIVFWDDGTKTVVKAMKGEKFERYAGFAMACMKKMFGSTGRAKAIMEECDDTKGSEA